MVLEAAVKGRAYALVTFNLRDYGRRPVLLGGASASASSGWEGQAIKATRPYPLRLRRSLNEAVERLSRDDRSSINQFVVMRWRKKISALQTARFFVDRRGRADFAAFDKIMRRRGGKTPRKGDEMPGRAK